MIFEFNANFFFAFFKLVNKIILDLPIISKKILFFFIINIQFIIFPIPLPIRTLIDLAVIAILGIQYNHNLY